MTNKNLIISCLVMLMVGVGSFFGGVKYQQKTLTSNRQSGDFPEMRQKGERVMLRPESNPAGEDVIMGEIINLDGELLSISLPNGGSKLMIVSANTLINKTVVGTLNDLVTGEYITAFGEVNAEGVIVPKSIYLGMRVGSKQE